MGWQNSHLHQFNVNTEMYTDMKFEILSVYGEFIGDESKMTVANIAKEVVEFYYQYDFGDCWDHTIEIEKSITVADKIVFHPICVGGENNCPPEDCGGIVGYEILTKVLNHPNHPEYKELNSWTLGQTGEKVFNPLFFDLLHVNAKLAPTSK
jgi:hypothetical protein